MTPQRIQLRRTKGWTMPADTVKVDRTTKFGNPFPVDVYGQAKAVAKFERFITDRMGAMELKDAVRQDKWAGHASLLHVRTIILACLGELRGKNLACWCGPDEPCHADVYLKIANGENP